jgi:Flp pilus assembly protein TadG
MTVEAVILAPVVFVFVLLIVGGARYELARQQVVGDARAVAETAAVAADASAAQQAAGTVTSGWATAGPGPAGPGPAPGICVTRSVTVNVADFEPGGSVTATVSCHVELSSVFLPGIPGTSELVASETAPIDRYRSVTSGGAS